MKFLECVEVNPAIPLIKGQLYPFVEMANVKTNCREPSQIEHKEFTSGVRFQDGDSVIARIEPCLQNGKKFFCHNIGVGFGSTEFLVFRPKNGVLDGTYLYYLLQTDDIHKRMICSMTGATGRQRVNNDIFKHIEIVLPEIGVQKKIANILSLYDDLIENNQKQIRLLEEAAQRLYKEWFVDLRFSGYETTPVVNGVPEGWNKASVGSLLKKIPRTKQIMTSEILPAGTIPVIDQSRNFIAGYTNDAEAVVGMDIPVIVFGDHTRILKYIPFPFAKGADGTQLIVTNNERMPQSLFYCSLMKVDLSNYHYARHFKYLKAEEILLPSLNIACQFDSIVSSLFKQVQMLQNKCSLAMEARDHLLPKLMNGEIEV